MESVQLKAPKMPLLRAPLLLPKEAVGSLYVSLFKPALTAAIVLSALTAAFATGRGSLPLGTLVMLGVVVFLASSGSCAMNHFLDRGIDGIMERTKRRPIPSGRIGNPRRAFWMGLVLIGVSLALSSLYLNAVVGLYLFLGVFVYVVVYTIWLKKRSPLNIVIGGAAGSFAVLAGGASWRPEPSLTPLILALILFLWTPSHFWSFAVANREDYKKAEVPMLPVLVGSRRAAWYILANTVLLLLASLLPFAYGLFGGLYLATALAIGAFFIFENLRLVARPTEAVAMKNFQASMVYLFILLLSVIVDTVFLGHPAAL